MPRGLITLVVVALLAGAGYYFFIAEQVVVLPPGVHAPDDPLQIDIEPTMMGKVEDYTVSALAGFELRAKVLGRERYRFDRESDLSPVDLALGWGRMSDQAVVDAIDISQGGRWYRFRYSGSPPIPQREIEQCSANMHLIPADGAVRSAILDAKQGEVIELSGYLVRVHAADGWRWQSSTTRNDTGDGACEVIWVESFRVVDVGVAGD